MEVFRTRAWFRILFLGVVYVIIGYGSAALDASTPESMDRLWRFGAWGASALLFAAHISYEHFRLRNSPRVAATNVSLAVAMGGFLLAIAALIHAAMVPNHAPYLLYLIALVVWPLVTAAPAFLVALIITTVLKWLKIPAAQPVSNPSRRPF